MTSCQQKCIDLDIYIYPRNNTNIAMYCTLYWKVPVISLCVSLSAMRIEENTNGHNMLCPFVFVIIVVIKTSIFLLKLTASVQC